MHKSYCYFAMMLFTNSAIAQEHLLHAKIKEGSSFLFSQELRKNGQFSGVFSPRFEALARNKSNGLIFTIGDGPPQKSSPQEITKIVYQLNVDACVVDVTNGMALVNGVDCDKPLATDANWKTIDRSNKEMTCAVKQAEEIEVRAGKFNALQIECRSDKNKLGNSTVANLWYVARLGSMVKTIHRGIDANGDELYLITSELVSCRFK